MVLRIVTISWLTTFFPSTQPLCVSAGCPATSRQRQDSGKSQLRAVICQDIVTACAASSFYSSVCVQIKHKKIKRVYQSVLKKLFPSVLGLYAKLIAFSFIFNAQTWEMYLLCISQKWGTIPLMFYSSCHIHVLIFGPNWIEGIPLSPQKTYLYLVLLYEGLRTETLLIKWILIQRVKMPKYRFKLLIQSELKCSEHIILMLWFQVKNYPREIPLHREKLH